MSGASMAGPQARLVHIHLGKDGGSERFFVRLVNALAARGVEQAAFIRRERSWASELDPRCRRYEMHFSRSLLKRWVIAALVNRRIAAFDPGAVLAWMGPAGHWLPKPTPSRRSFIRLGDFPDGFRAFGTVERIIGNTPEVVSRCVEAGWPRERIDMISNFVPQATRCRLSRRDLDTPDEAFVVVAVGRLVRRKGFDLVIDAVARLPDAYLWIVGDGVERETLEAQTMARDVAARTRFVGWVADPIAHLQAADVLCFASRLEPLGNVVLEAWAAGCPVVCTASEGPSWLVTDGETGLLTPVDDVDALVRALEAVRQSATLGQRLAEGGHVELQRRFSEQAIVDRYMAVLFPGDR